MSLHLVGYSERGGPHLVATGAEGVVDLPIAGPFAWRASAVRWCTGRWSDAGHVACPTMEVVGDEGQCLPCSGLEHPECVFEPLCQNNPASCLCVGTFKGVEHVVYLAFHGILPKVGMTQARRVERRLREQGADAYFVVQGGLDRPGARLLERSIRLLHKVPEHRNHHETLPQLARPVAWPTILERAAAWRIRLAEHEPGLLATIEDYPVAQPLPARPRRVTSWGLHAGTWLGAKGSHLFYQEAPRAGKLAVGPSIAALKMRDLVGRRIEHSDARADEPA
ncbi:MAG: DUF2797 domain-containing protein [Candidatus Thermoplasmatota archaeon]